MFRISCPPRPNLDEIAQQFGFNFHIIDGEPYWDETAYYQLTLSQIENDLEDPTEELHQMCLDLVADVVNDERQLQRLDIPPHYWQAIADSWQRQDFSLYGRMDFSYNGQSPAKLLEYNADTPTSLYEAAFFQWVWLEHQVNRGVVNAAADQFNSIQEKLIARLAHFAGQRMFFASCQDTDEDRGTVQYLQDCAAQAGVDQAFVYIEDIGLNDRGQYTAAEDEPIERLFKLYPWEFMFEDSYGYYLPQSKTQFVEPLWKAILSNKGILPLLWERHAGHPNLLPAYFEDESHPVMDWEKGYVVKPLLGREGSNISLFGPDGQQRETVDGEYFGERRVLQANQPLPRFGNNHTLIGSWVIGNEAAGLTIREDISTITQDTSRFLPHIILGD